MPAVQINVKTTTTLKRTRYDISVFFFTIIHFFFPTASDVTRTAAIGFPNQSVRIYMALPRYMAVESVSNDEPIALKTGIELRGFFFSSK